jgi:hypothetical protein
MRLRNASLWASSPSQLTPHPARFPMKCIGTAGHPLPKGESCFNNFSAIQIMPALSLGSGCPTEEGG